MAKIGLFTSASRVLLSVLIVIVFKGFILPLMSAKGAMKFCGYNNILNKDYKKWMMEQSKRLVEAANQYGKDNCGQGIIPISTWRIRKEALAHKRQIDEKLKMDLSVFGPVWSRLPRIVPVIVKGSDILSFEIIKHVVSTYIFTLIIMSTDL